MENNNSTQPKIISKDVLKHWYRAANRLTIAHFSATFDSFWHKEEITPIIGDIEEKLNVLEQEATNQAKEALSSALAEIQKLKGENFVQGTTIADIYQTTKTILELLDADDKDISALRELVALINQNITKIEAITSQKLDVEVFQQWIASDFQSVMDDLAKHTHSEFADNHTHANSTILNQITAAFTTALQQKIDGMETGANRYTHPSKPVSGSDEIIAPTKFVSGITTDEKGHIVKLVTKDVNKPNAPLVLNSNGVIDSTFLPSYVDDVLEVPLFANLPNVGESGKIYVVFNDTAENNGQYRWSGTNYICISKKIDIADDTESKSGTSDSKMITPLKMLGAFLYWLGSKAIGTFTKSDTAVTSSDSVVSAIGKLQGQIEVTTPVAKGGTSATTAQQARTNLEITPSNIGASPTIHTHSVDEIGGLQTKLDEKSPTSHNHDGSYEPKDSTLQSQKHTHSNKSVLDGISSTLIAKWNALVSFVGFAQNGAATAGKAVEANDSRLSNARTPTAHTHSVSDIGELQTKLDGKSPTSHNHDGSYEPKDSTLQSQKHTHSNKSVLDGISSTLIAKWNALVSFVGFAQNGAATAGKAVEANDSRLSNARTPTAHTHTHADLPTYPTQVTYNNKYHASWNEQIRIALTNPSDPGDTQNCKSIGFLYPNSPTVNGTTGVITAKGFYQN